MSHFSCCLTSTAVALWMVALPAGCGDTSKTGDAEPPELSVRQIEIAPGKWLEVKRIDNTGDWRASAQICREYAPDLPHDKDWTWLSIPYGGVDVIWVNLDNPITLREWEGRLFIVGMGHENTPDNKVRFWYYRQEGTGFKEIAPAEFPKQIATQNMWLKTAEWGNDGTTYYRYIDITRDLDVSHPAFGDTETARMWWHLDGGPDYSQQFVTGGAKFPAGITAIDVPASVTQAFKSKYKPVALPTIVKENYESLVASTLRDRLSPIGLRLHVFMTQMRRDANVAAIEQWLESQEMPVRTRYVSRADQPDFIKSLAPDVVSIGPDGALSLTYWMGGKTYGLVVLPKGRTLPPEVAGFSVGDNAFVFK